MSDLKLELSGYAVLTEEPNLPRAHWVAGAVEEAGIPVHVEDDLLQDEFAVSQRAMGLTRIRVLVPADRLEEARTVFLGLSQPIPLIDEDEDEEFDEDPDRLNRVSLVLAAIVLLLLAAAIVVTVNSCQPQHHGVGGPYPPEPHRPPRHPIHR